MIKEIIEKAKKENKKVYIYAHRFPDGDAISSSCAIAEYLRNQGIDAKYVITNKVFMFNKIVGDIPVTNSVENDGISIILDTDVISYAENTLFKSSSLEDTYVIDHHGKGDGGICIEDELELFSNNIIRNSNASSVCEILVNELDQEKITAQIANMLLLGILTDTGKLRNIKPETLKTITKLIELGADYHQILRNCSKKSNLRDEVGIAHVMLKMKTFPIGDTFGMILSMNNNEVNKLNRIFGVRNPQKKIFKMNNVENCSFMCMFTENIPGEYNAEFRSTPVYGNLDVLQLALSHRGGGHHNASGCTMHAKDGYSQSNLEKLFQQESSELFSEQVTNLPPITLRPQDKELSQILDKTKRLTEGVTPEVLETVDSLIKAGVNYEYIFNKFKSYEKFMLQNEILILIPSSVYSQRKPVVNITLSAQDIDALVKKYNITEDEILYAIDVFSGINVDSASITLPNGRKSFIDHKGNVTIKETQLKENGSIEMTK